MNNCRHFFFLSPNRDRKSFYQFDISSITGISTSGPTSGNTKRISFSSSSSLWVTLALALPNRNSDRIFRYLRMNPVNLKVRMVPIRQTVIKPHLQSFRPESLHPLPDQILAAQGRVQGLIVRIISFEQTKTFVVLGGDHRLLHTRSLRHLCPLTRIIQIRIEQVEILFRIFHQNLLIAHHPPISGRQGVQSSMDKPTETVACPPNHPFLLFLFRLILNLTLYLTCRSQ